MSRKIYQKWCAGDTINNVELAQAIVDYTAAHDALLKLGPAFEISRKEICRVLISLEGFKQARERK